MNYYSPEVILATMYDWKHERGKSRGKLDLHFPEDGAQWEMDLSVAAIWEAGNSFLLFWADFDAKCWEICIAVGNQSKGKDKDP